MVKITGCLWKMEKHWSMLTN
uniref:Uncharacterized protein n=1 Tax=Rhizophora mucronata TaxID=61149 RepID=A0A2P2NHS2_RHIMU